MTGIEKKSAIGAADGFCATCSYLHPEETLSADGDPCRGCKVQEMVDSLNSMPYDRSDAHTEAIPDQMYIATLVLSAARRWAGEPHADDMPQPALHEYEAGEYPRLGILFPLAKGIAFDVIITDRSDDAGNERIETDYCIEHGDSQTLIAIADYPLPETDDKDAAYRIWTAIQREMIRLRDIAEAITDSVSSAAYAKSSQQQRSA